ncbi:MAG: hypothetical protein A3I02_11740 [Betaproteobacteria bacterium RIFCSPLOWO2_02_FULL_67_26]|nr:MAG: hypothetical protein A3I02_11740 [Betaproteobacteria bacterium RIFCSPLOWO2_02_FULL_67_26]
MVIERRGTRLLLLAAGWCAAAHWGLAMAQPGTQAPAAKKAARVYYDQYEPMKALRLSRQDCLRTEESIGAFCVNRCQRGYVMVPGSNPPRCRSVDPLPPGQLPGPIRKEVGAPQPKPPQPSKPRPPVKGE